MLRWIKKECALRSANRYWKRGNFPAALEKISTALTNSPDDLDLLLQKAWTLSDMRNYAEALAIVQQALNIKPKNAVLHLIQGEIFYGMKEYEKARDSLHSALNLAGENLRVEYMLGLVYVALGDMTRATQFFESTVRYDKALVHSRLLAMAERYLFERSK